MAGRLTEVVVVLPILHRMPMWLRPCLGFAAAALLLALWSLGTATAAAAACPVTTTTVGALVGPAPFTADFEAGTRKLKPLGGKQADAVGFDATLQGDLWCPFEAIGVGVGVHASLEATLNGSPMMLVGPEVLGTLRFHTGSLSVFGGFDSAVARLRLEDSAKESTGAGAIMAFAASSAAVWRLGVGVSSATAERAGPYLRVSIRWVRQAPTSWHVDPVVGQSNGEMKPAASDWRLGAEFSVGAQF